MADWHMRHVAVSRQGMILKVGHVENGWSQGMCPAALQDM